jgi:hypothetical protein
MVPSTVSRAFFKYSMFPTAFDSLHPDLRGQTSRKITLPKHANCSFTIIFLLFPCRQPKAAIPANLSATPEAAPPTQPAGKPAPKRTRKRPKHPMDKPPASKLGAEVSAVPPSAKRAQLEKVKASAVHLLSIQIELGRLRLPDVQLPTEILGSIVKLMAAAKPRTKPRTPLESRHLGMGDFYVRNPEFELRAMERLAAMDLARKPVPGVKGVEAGSEVCWLEDAPC